MSGLDKSKKQLIVSIAGIRGIYPDAFNEKEAILYSRSLIRVLKKKYNKPCPILLIGRDTRQGGSEILETLTDILSREEKAHFLNAGIETTPCLHFTLKKLRADALLIISASHNPPEYNALKIVENVEHGSYLGSDFMRMMELEMKDILAEQKKKYEGVLIDSDVIKENIDRSPTLGKEDQSNILGRSIQNIDAWTDYNAWIYQFLGNLYGTQFNSVRERPVAIIVDPGAGAAATKAAEMLKGFHTRVQEINSFPASFADKNGKTTLIFPRKIEPTPDALSDLSNRVRGEDVDVGFAFDMDGDRITVVDEHGKARREDLVVTALIDEYLTVTQSKHPVVISTSSSLSLFDVARKHQVKAVEVPTGERNIVLGMKKYDGKIGGEGSCGGLVVPEVVSCRDATLGAAWLTHILCTTSRKISEILDPYDTYHIEKDIIPLEGNDIKVGQTAVDILKMAVSEREASKDFLPERIDAKEIEEHLLQASQNGTVTEIMTFDGIKVYLRMGEEMVENEGNKARKLEKEEYKIHDPVDTNQADAWWSVRASNTEPIIRIMTEAREESCAKIMCSSLFKAVNTLVEVLSAKSGNN